MRRFDERIRLVFEASFVASIEEFDAAQTGHLWRAMKQIHRRMKVLVYFGFEQR